MDFDKSKRVALNKKDRSEKGNIDEPIEYLVYFINSLKNYYTTSSCAGRIIVLELKESESKKDAKFLFRSHEAIDFNEIKQALNNMKTKNSIWLMQEPVIIHVCSRTFKDAEKFLKLASPLGFKRSGIISSEKRIIIEIVATERIETIISKNGKMLPDDNYLKILVDESNRKLEKTRKKAKILYNQLKNKNIFK